MSNPSDVVLACLQNPGPALKKVEIKYDLHNSVHVQLNNFRFDMSIAEFQKMAQELAAAQEKICADRGYSLGNIDPLFFSLFADLLPDIDEVSVEMRKLGDLRALVNRDFGRFGSHLISCRLSKTPAYEYLVGKPKRYLGYEQISYLNDDNEGRLLRLKESIIANGYPHHGDYITLFGNQQYIRDGQHRAAVLASIYGFNHEIPVRVIKFNGNGWRLSPSSSAFSAIAYSFKGMVINRFVKPLRCR
jgi:hypothetical protein